MDMKVSSTIGYERDHNPTLAVADQARFVAEAIAGLGPQPPNFKRIVAVNRGPLLRETLDAHPLTPRQVEAQRAEGALVVDVRTDLQFDDAHIPGAVCITILRAGFGSKLAWLADHDQAIVTVGRDDDDAKRGVELAAAVGIRRIGGYLAGGMTSWREEKRSVQGIERVDVEGLHERFDADGDLQILDVRERTEWESGRIPGSLFTPYHDIHELPAGLDAQRPVAAICGSGQRSAVAASLLQRFGAGQVLHVVEGGVPEWGRRGFPLEEPADR